MAAVSVFPGVRLLSIGDANGEIQRHAEQRELRLEARAGDIALYNAENVCVFKCTITRDTECSRVGKQSFIVTLGCNSVLVQFATPADFCSFYNIIKSCRCPATERSVFSERTEESSAVQYFQVCGLMTVWLSTAPTEPLTHWYQVRCLLQSPIFTKAGDTLSGTVLLIANKKQSYDISIVAQVDQTGSKSSNLLDLKNPFFRYTGSAPSPPPGSHYSSPSENMWNTGGAYTMNTGMGMGGMPTAYDLSSVIGGSSGISHSNLIPLGEPPAVSCPPAPLHSEPQDLTLGTSTNTGIVNHTHSRMGSIMSTGIVQGSAGGQAASNSSSHYPVNNQFTMGGPAISMASPMSITTNTMHYGS
ncbi:hypothetical protein XELAEV_18000741mg [Xenopus laevis]|nr:hypothetical protein XELAEV_18000741mg [Xenopus laevis]